MSGATATDGSRQVVRGTQTTGGAPKETHEIEIPGMIEAAGLQVREQRLRRHDARSARMTRGRKRD